VGPDVNMLPPADQLALAHSSLPQQLVNFRVQSLAWARSVNMLPPADQLELALAVCKLSCATPRLGPNVNMLPPADQLELAHSSL
jgi:hypothetical protein